MRPRSLVDVSRRVAEEGEAFDPTLREFLEHFHLGPQGRASSLAQAPIALDPLREAYLAATAEHLASIFCMQAPVRCGDYGVELRQPYFAGNLESLKALLTVQSPAAFRRRLLFGSKDGLARASQHATAAIS